MTKKNTRAFESGIHTDLKKRLTYSHYLGLDQLLNAQHPVGKPPHRDELLFIIQHQTSELWMKLMLHELRTSIVYLQEDNLDSALKCLARIKVIQHQLFEQWEVLESLTPNEYIAFRDSLGNSSGFQSWQYRAIELTLGNKNRQFLSLFEHSKKEQSGLKNILEQPSLYDEFFLHLARIGLDIPGDVCERDWSEPHQMNAELLPALIEIYDHPQQHWNQYNLCEKLVDVEEQFQLWRFRHMKTVERIIGNQPGTGGSSGVAFLKKALDLCFFPELIEVRTHLGKS